MKKKYTQGSFFEIRYECVDLENHKCLDDMPIGYFVSKEEALQYLNDEILKDHDYKKNTFWAYFTEIDTGLMHQYKIRELLCGRAAPNWTISKPVSLS